jgi:hypothetical protein
MRHLVAGNDVTAGAMDGLPGTESLGASDHILIVRVVRDGLEDRHGLPRQARIDPEEDRPSSAGGRSVR